MSHHISNILDLILTQDEKDINNIEYSSPIGKSDHVLLKITTNILSKSTLDKEESSLNWKHANYNDLKKYLNDNDWNKLYELKTEEQWKFVFNTLENGVNQFIPLKRHTTCKKKPNWFKGQVKKSVKRKYYLWKKYIESENSVDYQNYILERNNASKLLKKAKKEHEKKLAENCKKKS